MLRDKINVKSVINLHEQTCSEVVCCLARFVWIICVFLCPVFLVPSRRFIAALWSPARTGLTAWLLLVMFIVFLLLYHVVFWVRCGT